MLQEKTDSVDQNYRNFQNVILSEKCVNANSKWQKNRGLIFLNPKDRIWKNILLIYCRVKVKVAVNHHHHRHKEKTGIKLGQYIISCPGSSIPDLGQ